MHGSALGRVQGSIAVGGSAACDVLWLAMTKRPKVYVCSGKKCCASPKRKRALVEALEPVARVVPVGCQKICAGPVVALEVDGQLEWFKQLDSDKACRRMVELLQEGTMRKALSKRRVAKRSGHQPRGK